MNLLLGIMYVSSVSISLELHDVIHAIRTGIYEVNTPESDVSYLMIGSRLSGMIMFTD